MDRKTMDGGNLMDFVQRFRQLQVQRDTSDELIKVRCVLAALLPALLPALLLRRPSWDSLAWQALCPASPPVGESLEAGPVKIIVTGASPASSPKSRPCVAFR